jgi:hypothetical protein
MENNTDEEMSAKELYIPLAIPDSDDYISGIGRHEVVVIALGTLIAIIVGVFFTIIFNTIVGVSIGAISVASVISFIRRDIYNENLLKKIKVYSKFKKAQKKFIYVFHNEFNSDFEVDDEDE